MRREAAAVDLLDVAVERAEVAHEPGRRDPAVLAEDVRVLDHVDVAESAAAKRRGRSRGGGELGEVADEEAGHAGAPVERQTGFATTVVTDAGLNAQRGSFASASRRSSSCSALRSSASSGREELVLELLDQLAQPRQLALARRRDADDVAAPVERVALPGDQSRAPRAGRAARRAGSGRRSSASAIVPCVSRTPSARIASTL